LTDSQKVAKALNSGRLRKKFRRQDAQILRNEAYFVVRRNKPAPAKAGEGCSATQHPDFLRSRQDWKMKSIQRIEAALSVRFFLNRAGTHLTFAA
jgi:hypothetical protein